MRRRSIARATRHRVARLALVALAGTAACGGEEVLDPPFRDAIRPRVAVAKGGEAPDSLLAVAVTATDNIGLKRVRLLLDGGLTATFDTTFTSAVTTLTVQVRIPVPRSAPVGATVIVRGIATDGAGPRAGAAPVDDCVEVWHCGGAAVSGEPGRGADPRAGRQRD